MIFGLDRKKVPKLLFSILLANMAGIIGSLFTTPNIPTWYATINRPAFTPPSWIFAPVWTSLFVLMGISLFIVWDNGLKKNKKAVGIFGVQLILNTLWSILFFGMQNPFLGLVEIMFLWLAIFATILAFYKISKTSAYLLIPYILWVSFAAFLNYSIWILN